MNKQAYINGFYSKCAEKNIDPSVLLKSAGSIFDFLNTTSSKFDNPIYGKLFNRVLHKGRWLPIFYPSERRWEIQQGDTPERISQQSGVSVDELYRLNNGRPLIAGSTWRIQ